MTAPRRSTGRPPAAGFTLIELMVTLTVLGLLMAMALPSFAVWLRNARVRTVAQQLQDGLRTAQTEALRRNRVVVFSLTNAAPARGATAIANGSNWMINRVEMLGFENSTSSPYIGGGVLTDSAPGVSVTGLAGICFNTAGRLAANAATGVAGAATCTVDAAALPVYNVSASGGDRPLRITVALGGQIRVCDPARTQSASVADGCP